MNPLIQGLFNRFRDSQELATLPDSDAFELFSASLVLGEDLLSQLEVTDLLLDAGALGIDVALMEINGQVAWDEEDVRDICEASRKIEVHVYFVQAKQSSSISSSDVLSFGDAVRRFLDNSGLTPYHRLASLARALRSVFDDYATSLKTPPSVALTFATTAPKAATADLTVQERAATVRQHIETLGFVGKVTSTIWGADDLHEAWVRKNHANEVEIQFEKQVNLPKMPGVDQAILVRQPHFVI